MSSFGDILNRISLIRRWNRREPRPRTEEDSSRLRRGRKSRGRVDRREKVDRRNFDTAGAIFSVKFLGLHVVGDAYDESGCRRAFNRRSRRGHHHSIRHVFLSFNSTSIKIIQHHRVVLEHAVTAVSTCYTDTQRPQLFAYIVKDYTSGNHLCVAFKTSKRSALTGERLQKVFGYAFDSCGSVPSSLLSTEESSSSCGSTAELERCLQIYNHSRHHFTQTSNSCFSAVSETIVGKSLSRSKSHRMHIQDRRRKKRSIQPTNGRDTHDSTSGVCHSRTQQTIARRNTSRENQKSDTIEHSAVNPAFTTFETGRTEHEMLKCPQLAESGLNRCFFCQDERGTNTIDRSVSDSYLHCKLRPLYSLTHDSPGETNAHSRHHFKGSSAVAMNPVALATDAKCDLLPLIEDQETSTHCSDAYSSERQPSEDNIVLLLTTSEHHENSYGEGTHDETEPDSTRMEYLVKSLDERETIERQVAYVNLATQDSGSTEHPPLATPSCIAKTSAAVSITSSEIPQRVFDVSTFHSKVFAADLTMRLGQLANSLENRPPTSHIHSLHLLPYKVSQELVQALDLPSSTSQQLRSDTASNVLENATEDPHYHSSSTAELNTPPDTDTAARESSMNEAEKVECDGPSLAKVRSLSDLQQLKEKCFDEQTATPQCREMHLSQSLVCINASHSDADIYSDTVIKADQLEFDTVIEADQLESSLNREESFVQINSSATQTPASNQSQSPTNSHRSTTPSNTSSQSTTTNTRSDTTRSAAVETDRSATHPSVIVATQSACGSSCSQCVTAREVHQQLSRVLGLMSSPLLDSGSAGEAGRATNNDSKSPSEKTRSTVARSSVNAAGSDGESGNRNNTVTLTCFIATWEDNNSV